MLDVTPLYLPSRGDFPFKRTTFIEFDVLRIFSHE